MTTSTHRQTAIQVLKRNASETLHVVLAADDGFAMPLAVTVTSLLRSMQGDLAVVVHVLDGGISIANKRRIERAAHRTAASKSWDLRWTAAPRHLVPDVAEYRFANTAITAATFLRFALPGVLPEDCRVAVFIDCDTVVKSSIGTLAKVAPDDAPLAAVRDFGMPTFAHRGFPDELRHRHGISGSHTPYFNAGMLVANMPLWRQQRVSERACEIVAEEKLMLRFNDQDALNIALADNWREIDLGWNLQTGAPDRINRVGGNEIDYLGESYAAVRQRAKVIHFTGNKPWDQGFTNPDRPVFVEALRRSGWFGSVGFRQWQAGWWMRLLQRQLSGRLKRWCAPSSGAAASSSSGARTA